MKKIDETFKFIYKEMGIEISPFLQSVIANPQKIQTFRNTDLEKIVREFAPICKKYNHILDGPIELRPVNTLKLYLLCRLSNKPHLQKMFELLTEN